MAEVSVAVLVTMDSKSEEALFVCNALIQLGVKPLLMDLSLRPHNITGADITGGDLAIISGNSWEELAKMDRNQATEVMVSAGIKTLKEKYLLENIGGVIGLGGANGTSMACSLMRSLPPLVPKVMVSAVAATAAVQWYIAESDIVMFPSIGDFTLNRITRGVLQNAATALAAMTCAMANDTEKKQDEPLLIGVSSFGGTSGCVDVVTDGLVSEGYEVIHFHASGPGGKALESLAQKGELAGVVDITTHELTDYIVDGVYSAGENRLTAASAAGLPQVIVPGAIDHSNFWVNMVPEKYSDREFFQYNAQNILMRTNAFEYEKLGKLMAERLNQAEENFVVVIPLRGFSEHTKRNTHDLGGNILGSWDRPGDDRVFYETLKKNLIRGEVAELDLHINDPKFGSACLKYFTQLIQK